MDCSKDSGLLWKGSAGATRLADMAMTLYHKNFYMKVGSLFVFVCALMLSSCTSAFEKDVRKLARLTCEIQVLSGKAIAGDEQAEKELMEKQKEADRLEEEMKAKYEDVKNDQSEIDKGNRIFEEELRDCMKKANKKWFFLAGKKGEKKEREEEV